MNTLREMTFAVSAEVPAGEKFKPRLVAALREYADQLEVGWCPALGQHSDEVYKTRNGATFRVTHQTLPIIDMEHRIEKFEDVSDTPLEPLWLDVDAPSGFQRSSNQELEAEWHHFMKERNAEPEPEPKATTWPNRVRAALTVMGARWGRISWGF